MGADGVPGAREVERLRRQAGLLGGRCDSHSVVLLLAQRLRSYGLLGTAPIRWRVKVRGRARC